MATIPTNELRRKRQELIGQLSEFDGKVIRGTVIERFAKCGKPGCKCATGTGHGPKYILTVNFPKKKPKQVYITKDYVNQVKDYVSNFQSIKDILEQLSEINRELLKRKEEL